MFPKRSTFLLIKNIRFQQKNIISKIKFETNTLSGEWRSKLLCKNQSYSFVCILWWNKISTTYRKYFDEIVIIIIIFWIPCLNAFLFLYTMLVIAGYFTSKRAILILVNNFFCDSKKRRKTNSRQSSQNSQQLSRSFFIKFFLHFE